MTRAPHRLLIVDDDLDTRELLREALADEFEICLAADAAEALSICERFSPEIVLTDESLPGLRGAELAVVLKDRLPGVRVILFSGHLSIPGADAADLVLRKPLDLPELHDAVVSQTH